MQSLASTKHRLERKLMSSVGRAIGDYTMISAGDKVLVGLSGGKDSYTLLRILLLLRQKSPIDFQIEAANLDPGYAGYDRDAIVRFADQQKVTLHLIEAPIEELVEQHVPAGKPACPLCSRVRRGALYSLAERIGASKLALGHHLDDVLETLLMNLFYSGSLRGMPPRYQRKNSSLDVIRPLCFALEADIATYARQQQFPVVPCASPHCASADRRRQVLKGMLATLSKDHPQLKTQMRRALSNVHWDTLFTAEHSASAKELSAVQLHATQFAERHQAPEATGNHRRHQTGDSTHIHSH